MTMSTNKVQDTKRFFNIASITFFFKVDKNSAYMKWDKSKRSKSVAQEQEDG